MWRGCEFWTTRGSYFCLFGRYCFQGCLWFATVAAAVAAVAAAVDAAAGAPLARSVPRLATTTTNGRPGGPGALPGRRGPSKIARRRPQIPLQDSPRSFQESPKTTHEGPNTVPDAPGAPEAPRGPRAAHLWSWSRAEGRNEQGAHRQQRRRRQRRRQQQRRQWRTTSNLGKISTK